MNMYPTRDPASKRFSMCQDMLKLGMVNFLTDLSSEIIFSVFAIYFTTVTSALAALLGLMEVLVEPWASSLSHCAGGYQTALESENFLL